MRLSENEYKFRSELLADKITSELSDKTLSKRRLVMATTSKDFIGTVSETEFSIIDSFFPIGAGCVIKGEIGNDAVVSLKTSLHKPFLVLYYIWLSLVSVALVVLGFTVLSLFEFLNFSVLLIIGAIAFRLFIHVVYVVARNHALEKIKSILRVLPV